MGGTHVVRGRNGNAVLEWMPAHMQNLLVEVNLVRIRLLTHPLACSRRAARTRPVLLTAISGRTCRRVDRSGNAHFLGLERRLVGLQYNLNFLLWIGWVDHEVIVVAASHDVLAIARKDNLKLVEDTVIFVGVAKPGPQMLVDRDRLDRLPLHVDVPDLHRQVISRENVSAVVRKPHV